MKTNCNLQRQIGDLTFHQRTKEKGENLRPFINGRGIINYACIHPY
jgi:hypothetical protein